MYHGERFNAWSHLLGAVAAFIGAVWMLVVASMDGSPWKIVSVAIYGVTLLVLYTVGIIFFALEHRLRHSHGIWHLFVIGGSLLHFVAIMGYVL